MQQSKPLKSIILVLGMHRSGTSLVTRLVAAQGFSLPVNIVSAHTDDNPQGYQESQDVLDINNLFLNKLGSHWQDPGSLPISIFSGAVAEESQNQIRQLLKALGKDKECLVIKDPRLCRLLPLWLPILHESCESLGVIHVVRSPEAIYRSLSKRSQFAGISGAGIIYREHSDALWWRYNSEAVVNTKNLRSHTINYAALLENPDQANQLLTQFLSFYACQKDRSDQVPVIRRESAEQQAAKLRQQDVECFLNAAYQTFSGKGALIPMERLNNDQLRVPDGPWNIQADAEETRASCAGILKELSGTIPHLPVNTGKLAWWKRVIHKEDRDTLVFISHSSLTKGHIYRVKNPLDALNRAGSRSVWFDLETASSQMHYLDRAKCIIIHRCAWNDKLASIFTYCRRHNIAIGFDIDDLLFKPEVITGGEIDFINRLSDAERNEWLNQVNGYRKTAEHADFMIVTTRSLAQHAHAFHPHVTVIPNGFSPENLVLADLRRQQGKREEHIIKVGYASGTPTHQQDFAMVAPALWRLMADNPAIHLCVIGPLEFDPAPDEVLHTRIEKRPLASNINLSLELARFDINLAPLQQNSFCDAKSPLKYIEASIVSVPTVAIDNPSYADMIRHGEDGLLATSTADWQASISRLAADKSLRLEMADRARLKCESSFLADYLVPYYKLLADL